MHTSYIVNYIQTEDNITITFTYVGKQRDKKQDNEVQNKQKQYKHPCRDRQIDDRHLYVHVRVYIMDARKNRKVDRQRTDRQTHIQKRKKEM